MTGAVRKAMPNVGERAKLSRIVERFPHFWIAAGATGAITEASLHLIAMKMDEAIPGAEEWDNELCWSLDDASLYPGTAEERMAACIHADAELLGSDETVTPEQCQRRIRP